MPERRAEDANQAAARVVAQSTPDDGATPPDLEAAWQQWAGRIQRVDDRTRALLRAAFEAGYGAGHGSSAKNSLKNG